MSTKQNKPAATIGRVQKVYLLDYMEQPIVAKVDTGADLSSIWASNIREDNGVLSFYLFGPESPDYTGKIVCLSEGDYSITRVASSFGDRELRYTVKLRIKISGRVVLATFTLANRSKKTYPILLGRRLLQGKFVVDVSKGYPLRQEEQQKQEKLRADLAAHDKLEKESI
jgi:hypothetical protein